MISAQQASTEPLARRPSSQTVAWFHDLNVRGLLNLSPPYQRRSVWNQEFKDFFIDTILHGFPAPPIFLHEEISPDGVATYNVVDGKQRLETIFEFAASIFPVGERAARFAGVTFAQLPASVRQSFWTYQFLVEFLPTHDEATLNDIFDRINRNVARLTRQELRRAKFSGKFATAAENMADLMFDELPKGFPRIAEPSRRQMKDVELAAQLLLLIQNGAESFSQDELDAAYARRDDVWEEEKTVEKEFRAVIDFLKQVATANGSQVAGSRLRNQADFYSLTGAVAALRKDGALPEPAQASEWLELFVTKVDDPADWDSDPRAADYYDASRSASNDLSRRLARIAIITAVLSGNP